MKTIILSLVTLVLSVVASAAPTIIRDLTVVRTTGNRAIITCTVPSANVTQIELRARLGSNIGAPTYASSPIVATVSNPGPQGTLVTFIVTGLSNYSTYSFAAKAKDTVWCTTISNVFSGTTLGPYKNIRYRWRLADDGGSMPVVFFLEYGTTPSVLDGVVLINSGTTYTGIIPNLTWGTGYYFRVVSWNEAGPKQCSTLRYDDW
jgi:hypothetical protein